MIKGIPKKHQFTVTIGWNEDADRWVFQPEDFSAGDYELSYDEVDNFGEKLPPPFNDHTEGWPNEICAIIGELVSDALTERLNS